MAAGIAAGGGVFASTVSFAGSDTGQRRFVFVLLRGALDGLAVAPPVGDPDYARLRGELDLSKAEQLHRLDALFALHPALDFMSDLWQQKQLTLVHAVATPYRERSHFDGQDVLESGAVVPHATQSGWLNRALAGLPVRGRNAGIALGANVPLAMRGATEVASWSPDIMPGLHDDTLQRIAQMYGADHLLSQRLSEALGADAIAGTDGAGMGGMGRGGGAAQIEQVTRAAANFLVQPEGPSVAMFDTTGWDTHANEGADKGLLAARLAALDAGLKSLREGLGATWDRTVVLIATEFGRTAAVNGTRGTDHGTGAAAFLLGGAVRGGRVVGQWPGLKNSQLYQGRDLMPTTDLRSVMKSVLRDHLQVPEKLLDSEVFPDSAAARCLPDLLRA
ncbi:MAG TPA: DUF1501 domain-containing protein [Steroidobacteraceae bacterium]|nr:DUF1501 domain-containing protein [Steroidobacteraceae bacterium]